MKYLLPLVLILVTLVYLNRAYAHIFNVIGEYTLTNPNKSAVYQIKNKDVIDEHPTNYVALGDSLTAGVGASDITNTYAYLYANSLAKTRRSVNFYDLAFPSAKSEDVINYQLPKVLKLQPNIVTIMVGTNDVLNNVPASVFRENLNQIIATLKKNPTTEIILINNPFLDGGGNFNFPYNFYYDYQTREMNKIIASIAAENNLKYIDLYSYFKAQDQKGAYSGDGFHPSDRGYLIWSEFINAN